MAFLNWMKTDKVKKSRLVVLYVFVTLAWCLIIIRLIDIQVVHGSEYGEKAQKQSTGKIEVQPERGLIYDRKGRQLTVNIIRKALYAYPGGKREIANIHSYLDKLFDWKSGTSRRKYSLEKNRFAWIDRDLPASLADKVAADSIPGLYLKKETKREYYFSTAGRQLLGSTDIDGRGISGIEFSYDSVLAGRPGLTDYLRDGIQNTYRIREMPLVEPVPGQSIILSVDWNFQEIVEDELRKAVIKFHALGGTAIFIDCNSGEILAAADYDALQPGGFVKLRAASDCIEPGSAFKVFTAAALLDADVVDLDEKVYCENGLWKCGRRILHDDKKHDSLTFQGMVELSSNIGIAKLALRLGGEKLTGAAQRFGFGAKTYAGLPGEQSGSIGNPGVWSDYNVATLAIGHGISVTPLQLVTACAAVANGGKLYHPIIVRGIIGGDGNLIRKINKDFVGNVVKEDNAKILRSFMKGVVERGTGTPVKSDIIAIAGKTGTAEVPNLKNGGYIKNKFVASFLGFFPADNPQVAGVVVLHQPEPIHYGGYTAGPAFKCIAERYSIANSEFLRPDTRLVAKENELEMKEIPALIGMEVAMASQAAEARGIKLVSNNSEGVVVWQYPPQGRRIPGGETVVVDARNSEERPARMIDLRGMKMRTAVAWLEHQRMDFRIKGNGVIRSQKPAPGELVNDKSGCFLACDES
jgi:cell division protein FtsI/penicillin-binding protein 2